MKYLLLHLIVILLTLIGCSDQIPRGNDVLVVGTSADNPPYEFIQNDEIVGMDIDVISAIASKLGKKVVIKNMNFRSLLGALDKNQVDLVIAGLTITDERLMRVNFSDPYTITNSAIVYRKVDNFQSYQDLRDRMVGAEVGTVQSQLARDLSKKKHHRVTTSNNIEKLISELRVGKIDAVMTEANQAKNLIKNNPDLGHFILQDKSSKLAIAINPQNILLRDSINNALQNLVANGSIDELHAKWIHQ